MKTEDLLKEIENIRSETAKRGCYAEIYCTLNRIRDKADFLISKIKSGEGDADRTDGK